MAEHIVLFVLTSCCLVLCDVITAEDDTKSDFEDILKLKQDLRRNNDDYVESTAGTLNFTNPYLIVTKADPSADSSLTANNKTESGLHPERPATFHFNRGPANSNNLINIPYRRQYVSQKTNEKESYNAYNTKYRMFNGTIFADTNTVRHLNVTTKMVARTKLSTVMMSTTLKNGIPSATTMDQIRFRGYAEEQEVKRKKIEKFKKFVERNQGMITGYVMKKRAERILQERENRQASELPPQAARPGAREQPDDELAPHAPKQLFRAHAPLKAQQLDMAPARGAKIHSMRISGNLCQRSVLVPEGPKYDSKGQVYLRAYSHGDHDDYNSTRRPTLLLPRCCNCCKKSVLGCE